MAFSKVLTCALKGLEPKAVVVECDVSSGLPAFNIVGLPDKAIEEAKERVRSALKNSGFQMPSKRITINLSPADLRKEGTSLDLPIAVALLIASGQLKPFQNKRLFYGELSLDGALKNTPAVLPALLFAKHQQLEEAFVPYANLAEAELVDSPKIWLVKTLAELVHHLHNEIQLTESIYNEISGHTIEDNPIDFSEIVGQDQAKRAVEIVAAGGHNILMIGSPGSGKTMLAKALPSIMPPLTHKEILEVTQIFSVAGKLNDTVQTLRPFRQPHHTSSGIAIVGGGTWPKPGEITLAHMGVLFMDEFLEFHRDVLEALREPLESGHIQIARSNTAVEFPAKFILVAACNPCPCGFLHDKEKSCKCSAGEIEKYRKKLSGPMLDRIDLQVSVPRLPYNQIQASHPAETSAMIRERVINARNIQKHRFKALDIHTNSEMSSRLIKEYCELDETSEKLLEQAAQKLTLSMRAIHKVIKIARTIADLKDQQKISASDIAEALQYRLVENI